MQKILVFELTATNLRGTLRQLTRKELLEEARAASLPEAVRAGGAPASDLLLLKARDVRKVDPVFGGRIEPVILVRTGVIHRLLKPAAGVDALAVAALDDVVQLAVAPEVTGDRSLVNQLHAVSARRVVDDQWSHVLDIQWLCRRLMDSRALATAAAHAAAQREEKGVSQKSPPARPRPRSTPRALGETALAVSPCNRGCFARIAPFLVFVPPLL